MPEIDSQPTGASEKVCGHVPMPGSGAYGHWYCQRRRWHLGRHRSNNYTWRRGAKWRSDLRYARLLVLHRLLRRPPWKKKRPYSRTRTQYDPVKVLGLNENGGFSPWTGRAR